MTGKPRVGVVCDRIGQTHLFAICRASPYGSSAWALVSRTMSMT